ncbi:SEC-C metal-binding domain-containing protein [Thiorhodococcus mannitoliphagus]|uniref:SEC-C metal-binding domain-containing protein n=1 Tax=Thiorhodococcus mannitoliphagus TaxID=329406 RepID=UPI00197FA90A|nr:SEC-C metal-binding domain-containing protein [Thiorhodococcus mannitoliphagus]
MLLELVAPSDAIHVVGEVPALRFDYRSKSWRIATSGEEDPQLLGRIAEEVATDAFMSFFQGRHARLKALYRGYQARNARRAARIAPRQSVGRNDPCPCGSGKKYKKCCLDAPQASLRA